MSVYLRFLVLILCITWTYVASLYKVIVPAVYKEWTNGKPDWFTNETLQKQYNYSTFLYQKLDPSLPNYIAKNRGTEAGVYLRYIVDHYYDFPDIAIFVHAHPHQHQERWLELLGCIHPNASYINFNERHICRTTAYWKYSEIWVEQCWRDILSIVWDLQNQTAKFNERVPISGPVSVCFIVSQQFLLSRSMVQRRPLAVWKKLLTIIGEQSVCHEGPLDYQNLYAYHKQLPDLLVKNQSLPGPETPNLWSEDETEAKPGWGAHTQGGGMEHLAHVVFGGKDLLQPPLSNQEYCENFLPHCPHTLCRA